MSGSSGRLVVERSSDEEEGQWPGRVFEDESLSYKEAMLAYVASSKAKSEISTNSIEKSQQTSVKAQKKTLRLKEAKLRDQRRRIREKRTQEDAAFKELKAKRRQQKKTQGELSAQERKVQDEQWKALRKQRKATQQRRKQEDQLWRQKRLNIRKSLSQMPIVKAWIAILVITDNCTRQCLGLPLFVAGPKVTSEMIVQALKVLLPPELLFIITDRGTHFIADAFKKLVYDEEFIHVLIARHRPQSNGIAERFVRTLKDWLKNHPWQDDKELALLLKQFLIEYNDRPHQGLPIPGLSPNEFAKRIWLM